MPLSFAVPSRAAAPADGFARNKELGRGDHLIGYDPIGKHRGSGRFQAGHFREIRKAGFDHVRINLHPFRDNRGGQEGKLRDEYLKKLDWAVDQALASDLMVILDFHEFQLMSSDPPKHKAGFLAIWNTV